MVITGGTQQLEYEIKKNGKSWINKIERFSNDCREINTKVNTGQSKAVKRAMFNQNSDVQFGITCNLLKAREEIARARSDWFWFSLVEKTGVIFLNQSLSLASVINCFRNYLRNSFKNCSMMS